MVSFWKLNLRFLAAALFAFVVGFGFVEAASAADTPPAAPQNLWQDNIAKNEIGLSWTASISTTRYNVYEFENGKWEPIKTISDTLAALNAQEAGLNSDLRLIQISNLECGTNYQFVVGAYNEKGESGPSPELSTSTVLCDPINVPIQIAPSEGMTFTTSQVVTLEWENGSQDPVDGYYYEVYGPRGLETTGWTIYTEVDIWWLPPGEYRWKSQAERRGIKGEWTEERNFTIYYYEDPNLAVPMPVWPVNGQLFTSTSSIDLDWLVPNENSIGSWIELVGPGDFLRTKFVTDTKSLEENLKPGNYQWRARYATTYLLSYWSETSHFSIVEKSVPSETVPVPTITAPISGSTFVTDEAILLEWTNMSMDGYNVEVEGPEAFIQTGFVTGTKTTLQFEFPGTYLAKVQSVKDSILSEWSEKVAIIVEPPLDPVIDCGTWEGHIDVTFFTEKDCRGKIYAMPSGINDLNKLGIAHKIFSIYVPAGMSVRIWETAESARTKCYAETMWDLAKDTWWQEEVVVDSNFERAVIYYNDTCTPPATHLPLVTK